VSNNGNGDNQQRGDASTNVNQRRRGRDHVKPQRSTVYIAQKPNVNGATTNATSIALAATLTQ
jgi:hypothetical protein